MVELGKAAVYEEKLRDKILESTEMSKDFASVVSMVTRKVTAGMNESYVERPDKSNKSEQEVSMVMRKATAQMDESAGEEMSTKRLEKSLDDLRMK